MSYPFVVVMSPSTGHKDSTAPCDPSINWPIAYVAQYPEKPAVIIPDIAPFVEPSAAEEDPLMVPDKAP